MTVSAHALSSVPDVFRLLFCRCNRDSSLMYSDVRNIYYHFPSRAEVSAAVSVIPKFQVLSFCIISFDLFFGFFTVLDVSQDVI